MIWEELDKSLIQLQLEADTPDEIFERFGGAFITEGYSTEGYVEALKVREEQFPTGLNIHGFGIAIPHTDASYVVKETQGIATLKHPVQFIQMGSDDTPVMINVVFILAIANPKTHIKKLQKILCILQDERVLINIYQAMSKDEVIEIIKRKEMEIGGRL